MSKQDLPEKLLRLLPLDAVALYARDLQQYPDLPMARKLELEQLVRQGDEQAKHEIIESALRYTARVAAFYYSAYGHFLHHDSYLDLVQIANLAMLEAFERALQADSINGYLRGTVKRAIRHYCLYRSGMIRVPTHEEWVAKAPRVESLDAMIGDTELTYHDFIAASSQIEQEDEEGTASRFSHAMLDPLHQTIGKLSEKQREVVVRHYGLDQQAPEPLYAISKRLGLASNGAWKRLQIALKVLHRELEAFFDEEEASH